MVRCTEHIAILDIAAGLAAVDRRTERYQIPGSRYSAVARVNNPCAEGVKQNQFYNT